MQDTFKEWLPYHFTTEEKQQISSDMARKHAERSQKEKEPVSVKSQFKSVIDQLTADLDHAARLINTGYEHRHIDCTVTLNDPEKGMKAIYRVDTGEFVRSAKMTGEDMQIALDLEEKAAEREVEEVYADTGHANHRQLKAPRPHRQPKAPPQIEGGQA